MNGHGQASYTPGPRIMKIHLVRNLTCARFGKNPSIFTVLYVPYVQVSK